MLVYFRFMLFVVFFIVSQTLNSYSKTITSIFKSEMFYLFIYLF